MYYSTSLSSEVDLQTKTSDKNKKTKLKQEFFHCGNANGDDNDIFTKSNLRSNFVFKFH